MSKKKESFENLFDEDLLADIVEDTAEDKLEEVVEVKKERAPAPAMIMFDRYFMSLGKPMHHKAGMVAYCNTKGKKTKEAWEALFTNY